MVPSADASSTSAKRRSPGSLRSAKASPTSGSSGDALGRGALRELAERHGITPSKALGQHFLTDPNLARAIVVDAGVRAGDRVLEVGAGLGSLTVALADAGAEVVAVELDRALLPALEEVVGDRPTVRIERADATDVDGLRRSLRGDGWRLVANLPYNISVPLVVGVLDRVPAVRSLVVMVQREVADRFVAPPGSDAYGPASIRVLFHADVQRVRSVPPEVFWPAPNVDSSIVRITRRSSPQLAVDRAALFRVVDVAFAERRKTLANGVRRLGFDGGEATAIVSAAGLGPSARAESTGMFGFAELTTELLARGWTP